jgi:DNA-binding NtrC family response regulator
MSPANAVPETGSGDESIQTILVVEDEVLIRLPLAEYLRDCGYRVFEASNVAEAKPCSTPTRPWIWYSAT